jgi:hypothetical protein
VSEKWLTRRAALKIIRRPNETPEQAHKRLLVAHLSGKVRNRYNEERAAAQLDATKADAARHKPPHQSDAAFLNALLEIRFREFERGSLLHWSNLTTKPDLTHLKRAKLERIRKAAPQKPAAPPTKRSRAQYQRDATKRVISILYSSLPDARKLPHKKLHAEVTGWLEANGEKPVGYDTVVRAAKAIRANAANALR